MMRPFAERNWLILPDCGKGYPIVVEVDDSDEHGPHHAWSGGMWGAMAQVGTFKPEVAATLRPARNKRERAMVAEIVRELERAQASQAALVAALRAHPEDERIRNVCAREGVTA